MKQRRSVTGRILMQLIVAALLIMLVVLPASAADWDGAVKALAAGMSQEAESIDISEYNIHMNDISKLYCDAADMGLFPWYVDRFNQFHYNYYISSGIVVNLQPAYLDRTRYNRNAYESKVKEILDQCIDEDMAQWQVALSLHDYIATHCEYDQRFYVDRDAANYYGYDCLVNNLAVCEGYSGAYMDLLKRVGIPSIRIMSPGMDHTWNMIQLDNKWYHVDITWDDPSFNKKDIEGYVSHDYFLMSDATMQDQDHKHYGWIKYYTCTDKHYESGRFWNDVNSSIILPDTEYCFLSRSVYEATRIYLRDSYTANETLIFQVEKPYGSNGYRYHSYGVSYDNGYVYCCDNQNVYAVSPDGKSSFTVYTNAAANRVIVGCYVEKGVLEVTTMDYNDNYQTTKVNLALPNNHKHSYTETVVEPTCQYQGYNRYACSCGSVFAAGYVDSDGQHVPAGGYEVTIEPDFGKTGEKWFTCRDCGQPIVEDLADLNTITTEFGDVASGKFYYEPVLWAYSRGVTTGTADGVFSPDKTCTRGQVVTFLWRAMGEPEPASSNNPFTDVKAGAYYYKAVLWAVENGITNGMSATTFEPNGSCTRGQVVTFLNRTAGNPSASSGKSQFTDVKDSAFYYGSMLWAVENGITNGMTATTFDPGKACSRGQIVTFLHRYLNP